MPVIAELEVYQSGELTVVGFGGQQILEQFNMAEFYDRIMDLVLKNGCQILALDLTGVHWIPSGLLGILISVHRLKVDVHLYNPSDDTREVLEITKLNQCFQVYEIDV